MGAPLCHSGSFLFLTHSSRTDLLRRRNRPASNLISHKNARSAAAAGQSVYWCCAPDPLLWVDILKQERRARGHRCRRQPSMPQDCWAKAQQSGEPNLRSSSTTNTHARRTRGWGLTPATPTPVRSGALDKRQRYAATRSTHLAARLGPHC